MANNKQLTTRNTLPAAGGSFDIMTALELTPQTFLKDLTTQGGIPKGLAAKPVLVMLLYDYAQRKGFSFLELLQESYIADGRFGFYTKSAIAKWNQMADRTPIRYAWEGEPGTDAETVTAYATDLRTGDLMQGDAMSLKIAKAEGWIRNPKYQTRPRHMLTLRAATSLIALYAPELVHGMATVEQIEDERGNDPEPQTPPSRADKINQAVKQQRTAPPQPEPAPVEPEVVESEPIEAEVAPSQPEPPPPEEPPEVSQKQASKGPTNSKTGIEEGEPTSGALAGFLAALETKTSTRQVDQYLYSVSGRVDRLPDADKKKLFDAAEKLRQKFGTEGTT